MKFEEMLDKSVVTPKQRSRRAKKMGPKVIKGQRKEHHSSPTSSLERWIEIKLNQWHDDDCDESKGDTNEG